MPTNSETSIFETLTATELAASDLVQVYDVNTGKVKSMALSTFISGLETLGITAATGPTGEAPTGPAGATGATGATGPTGPTA